MTRIIIALLFCPLFASSQYTSVGINGGLAYISPVTRTYKMKDNDIRHTINLEAQRQTKGLFYFGVQFGYSSLSGRYESNYIDTAYFTGSHDVINFYGKHSLSAGIAVGVKLGAGKHTLKIGANAGGLYNFSDKPLTRELKNGKDLYYAPNNSGMYLGLDAGYLYSLSDKVMIGCTVSPQRLITRSKSSTTVHFNRLLFTVGIHYTL